MAIAGAVVAALGITALFFGLQSAVSNPASGGSPVAQSTPAGTLGGPVASSGSTPAHQGAGAVAPAGTATADHPGCSLPGGQLTVAAAPAIAGAIRRVAAQQSIAPGSCTIAITEQDSAGLLRTGVTDASTRPDVWIPESTIWVRRAQAAGIAPVSLPTSVVSSPVVLALSNSAAARLRAANATVDFAHVLGARTMTPPIRLGIPDPSASIPAVGVLIAVRALGTGATADRAAVTWALRSSPPNLPAGGADLFSQLAQDPNTALPMSEQELWNLGRAGRGSAVPVYDAAAGLKLDFPFVVLSATDGVADSAATLLAQLLAPSGQNILLQNGFRTSAGRPGPVLAAVTGTAAPATAGVTDPATAVVDPAVQDWKSINEPSRLLAVLDVSGSMASDVPDAGGATRLDLAKAAAVRGLGLYSADSAIGLWTFSRNLTSSTDYRQLVPIRPLGTTGPQAIAQALAATQVNPDGGTGLYDTTLAAVRAVRANWDPHRVNLVLVLSDVGSISLNGLLAALKTEQDNAHPVPVITIAFGPDSTVAAMAQISQVTGGSTYVARDPRSIANIFLDAVGQRLCRPNCQSG